MPPTTSLKAAVAWVLVVVGAPILLAAPAASAVPTAPDPKLADCTIVGTPGDDVLVGTPGDDVICGLGGDDRLFGRGGDDKLRGGPGNDLLRGGPGDDLLVGGRGDDRLFGQGGDDRLRGGGGDDFVHGGPGNDRLGGFRGADVLDARDARRFVDVLRCGPGPDQAFADPDDVVGRDCENVVQNDPPTNITLAPSSIAENEPVGTEIGNLTATDPDPGDSHTFSLVPGPGSADNALVGIDGNSLESATRYDFEDDTELSVRIRATDAAGEHLEKVFTITVLDVNDPPVALDDAVAAVEDTVLDLPVSGAGSPAANDTDQDGDPLTVTAVANPTGGTVSISGGQIHFDPAANLCGPAAGGFDYTVSDGNGGTDVGTVTVDIACVDDPAQAVDDQATVVEDSADNVIDVLANDVDPEGDPIAVTGVTQPGDGTVTFSAAEVEYTPDANYCNSPGPGADDTFDYTVTGGDSATVSVRVTCVNDAPVAVDDVRTTTEDTPFSDPVTGAGSPAANDTDVDGDSLTVTSVSDPVGGTVQIAAGQITFTPTADLCAPAPASYDYTVSDGNGGTDTGEVTITVTCVNDDPVAVDDSRTTNEDEALVVSAASLAANDTDVDGDPLTVTAVSNPTGGTVDLAAGEATFTPSADLCGAGAGGFDYTVSDGNGGSDTGHVTVDITCVNDAPVVDLDTTSGGTGSSSTFNETDPHTGDGVLIAPNAEITDVDDVDIESATITLTDRPDGDADESLAFTSPSGSGIVGSYTAATGVLALSGTASKADYAAAIASIKYDNTANPPDPADRTITVVVNDGDADSPSATATVQVVPLNEAPDLDLDTGAAGNDATASFTEDGGPVPVTGSVAITDSDDTTMDGATVVLTARPDGNGNESLDFTLPGGSGISAGSGYDPSTGTLTFSGTSSIANYEALLESVTYDNASDDPTTTDRSVTVVVNDGLADSPTRTSTVSVATTNDAPTVQVPGPTSTAEDTPASITGISVADVDDTTLTVSLTVTNGTLTLATLSGLTFSTGDGTGDATMTFSGSKADLNAALATVTYDPDPDYHGPALLTAEVEDPDSASDSGTVAITVTPVNDAPVAAVPGAQSVDEDTDLVFSGGNGNALTVSDVDGGPLTIEVTVTNGTFTLSGTAGLSGVTGDGTATVTATGSIADLNAALSGSQFRGTLDYFGGAELTLDVSDGTLSDDDTVSITVNPVNDAPVAADVTFEGADSAIGNTALVVDGPGAGTPDPAGPQKTISGDILGGATDVDGPGPLVVVAETKATANGGSVTIEADGDFTFFPEAGASCTDASDSFTYTVSDQASPTAATDDGTVTIALDGECVWYVDAAAPGGGDGRSHSPFNTLAPVNTPGGVGDVDGSGDYLFLYGGGSFSTGLALEPDQRLFGQPHGLTVSGVSLVAPGGTNPNVYNAAGNSITLANGVEIQRVDAGTAAAKGLIGIRGISVTTATIGPNTQVNSTSVGVALTHAASGDITIGSTVVAGEGNAVAVTGRSGGTVSLTGAVTGVGLNSSVEIRNNTGATVSFTGKVSVSGNGTPAIPAFWVAGGGTIVASNAANEILNFTQTGVSLDGVTVGAGGVVLGTLSSAPAGAVNGLLVNNVTGSGAITVSGGSLTTTTRGLDVNAGANDVTVGATITSSGAGRSVEVTNRTGGTVDLNGAITENGTGINLATNTGATVRFDGGLAVSTGTNTAFNATGGGTVVVTDPNANGTAPDNTLSTSTGTALNVANTTIGAADLTFRSISSNGAASGIVLNNTGSAGGLHVTGDGGGAGNGSGGTIQSSTNAGVSLTSTSDVDLGYLNVTGGSDDGIKGVGVDGFRLNRSNVNSNGNSTADDGIQLGEPSGNTVGVTGAVSILNSSVSGNAHNNVHVRNTSGTISSLTVTGSSFNNLNDTHGANAFLFEASGTSVTTTATISGSTFQNNSPQRALEVQVHDTGTIGAGLNAFTVSGNTFIDNGIHASFTQDTAGNLQFKFQNNGTAGAPMTGSILQAVNVFSSSQSTGGTLVGTVSGNFIGNAAVAGSGSTQGGAVSAVIQGQTDATLLIDNNVTRQTSGDSRAISVAFRGPSNPLAGTLGPNTVVSDLTITNNNVVPGAAPSGFPLAAIVIEADNQTGADNKSPTVRADVRGNSVPSSPVFDFIDAQLIYYEYASPGAHGIGQLVDTAPASANATAQLQSTNTGTAAAGEGPADVVLIPGPITTPP